MNNMATMSNEMKKHFNFYHLDEFSPDCQDLKQKRNFKYTLLKIRKYFLHHNTYFIFLKISIGLLLLGIPFYLFRMFINKSSLVDDEESFIFYSAAYPLIYSIVFFMLYILGLFVFKCYVLVRNRFLFPPWERNSLGFLTGAFLISLGILSFVFSLVDCLQYIDTLRDKLLENLHSSDVLISTTARILLYNIFDQKVLNVNLTNLKIPIEMEVNFTNFSIPIIANTTLMNRNSKNESEINLFEFGIQNNFNFDSNRKDYLIVDVLLKLFCPILFICCLILIKIALFATKHSFYYLVFIFIAFMEYSQIRLNDGKENSISNLYEILLIYLLFGFYLLYILHNSYIFYKKHSRTNSHPSGLHSNNLKNYNRFTDLYYHNYTTVDKSIILFFDFLICTSLCLLLYSFSLCISYDTLESILHMKTKQSLSEEHTSIKSTSSLAIVLYIIGNFYKVGNSTLYFAFYTIEKEFFPSPNKKFYHRVLTIKNDYNFAERSHELNMENNEMFHEEDDEDKSPLISRQSEIKV